MTWSARDRVQRGTGLGTRRSQLMRPCFLSGVNDSIDVSRLDFVVWWDPGTKNVILAGCLILIRVRTESTRLKLGHEGYSDTIAH